MKDHSSEHGSFVVERTIDAPPSLVFTAFSTEESKKRWFAAPDAKYLARAFDFRVGGHDQLKGQWPNGLVSDFRAEYFDIVPDARIVYVYEMYLDDVKISVSLATVEFKPQGKGTRLIITEQAVFVDGYKDNGSREHGTNALMDQLVASFSAKH
jgi:uncharacterized protein YndB with AHSA1/START domain